MVLVRIQFLICFHPVCLRFFQSFLSCKMVGWSSFHHAGFLLPLPNLFFPQEDLLICVIIRFLTICSYWSLPASTFRCRYLFALFSGLWCHCSLQLFKYSSLFVSRDVYTSAAPSVPVPAFLSFRDAQNVQIYLGFQCGPIFQYVVLVCQVKFHVLPSMFEVHFSAVQLTISSVSIRLLVYLSYHALLPVEHHYCMTLFLLVCSFGCALCSCCLLSFCLMIVKYFPCWCYLLLKQCFDLAYGHLKFACIAFCFVVMAFVDSHFMKVSFKQQDWQICWFFLYCMAFVMASGAGNRYRTCSSGQLIALSNFLYVIVDVEGVLFLIYLLLLSAWIPIHTCWYQMGS